MKLKTIVIFLFSIFYLSACIPTTYYKWDISLEEPVSSKVLALFDSSIKPGTLMYYDDFIRIVFEVGQKRIGFNLENKTDKGITINWDKVAYVSPTGESMRVMHTGVRYIQRDAPQAPTVIPPYSNITDAVIPSQHIYFESGQYGGWRELNLFPGNDKTIFIGKSFSVFLPLEIKGQWKEYTFTFKINNITKMER